MLVLIEFLIITNFYQDTEGVKKLQKVVDQSLSSKFVSKPFKNDSSSIECKILDPYEAKDVFPDELAEDIVGDIVNLSMGDKK